LNGAERTVTATPYLNIRYFPVLSQLHDIITPPTLAKFVRRMQFRLQIFITPSALRDAIESPPEFTDTQITLPV
jgi:hypothetical protein